MFRVLCCFEVILFIRKKKFMLSLCPKKKLALKNYFASAALNIEKLHLIAIKKIA